MATNVSKIITLLQKMQADGSDARIEHGVFPAYRAHDFLPYKRLDDNIYFTALVIMILQEYYRFFDDEDKTKVAAMVTSGLAAYRHYANRFGLPTYNFWRQNPSRHFPNGFLFRWFSRFQLADDTDDTVLMYITENRSREEVMWLKNEMKKHTNRYKHQIYTTFEKYNHLKAYSVWFGKNMYIEFDAAILSNILYFVFYYRLPLNEHDHDSIAFLKSVLENGEHLSHSYLVSHYYYQPETILYHIGRLIAHFDVPGLSACREIIIRDAKKLLPKSKGLIQKALLASTLLMLGETVEPLHYSLNDKAIQRFCFFTASLLKPYENRTFLGRVSRFGMFHVRWRSPAHTLALLLEYEILQQKSGKF